MKGLADNWKRAALVAIGVVAASGAMAQTTERGPLGGPPIPKGGFVARAPAEVDVNVWVALPPLQEAAEWSCDAFAPLHTDEVKGRMASAGVANLLKGEVALRGRDGRVRTLEIAAAIDQAETIIMIVPDPLVVREACPK